MSKEDVIETEGKVIEVLPKTQFRVMLTNGHEILAYLGGKLRIKNIGGRQSQNRNVAVRFDKR